MENCFGPWGAALAPLGAIGLSLAFIGAIGSVFALLDNDISLNNLPIVLLIFGVFALSLCVLIGLINQAYLPNRCFESGQSRPTQEWLEIAWLLLVPWGLGFLAFLVALFRHTLKKRYD